MAMNRWNDGFVFLLCFDLSPGDQPCMAEVVWDALGAVIPADEDTMPSSEQVQSWSRTRLMTAYEWAMHEAFKTDHRTPRPAFTFPWKDF